jgi:hypothetical protein
MSTSIHPSLELNLENVRDGTIKIKTLKLAELKDLCTHLYDLIKDLEVKLEKAKVPSAASISDEAYELRAELKELKDVVLVDEDSIVGMGDKPTGSLLQAYWALGTGNRRAIPWDIINKFVEEATKGPAKDNATSSGGDDVKGAAKVSATSSGKEKTSIEAKESNDTTSSKAKLAKLAKLVEMAKSTDLWCLTPFVPSTQEAKAKQRKVCPVNL